MTNQDIIVWFLIKIVQSHCWCRVRRGGERRSVNAARGMVNCSAFFCMRAHDGDGSFLLYDALYQSRRLLKQGAEMAKKVTRTRPCTKDEVRMRSVAAVPRTIFSFFKFFEIAIAPGRCRFQRVISLFSLRYFLFEKLSRPLNLLSNSRLTARGRGRLQALWKNPNGRRRL